MIRFCHRTKGAISVFLVIIMLPMMLLSWLLIDSARVRLAETRLASATDLALNTALTNYDNILKEMYGLFAMSQTETELYENLDEYFTRNLQIAGLDPQNAEYMADNILYQIFNLGKSEPKYPYTDFLAIELDSFNKIRTPMASLANPEILKDQIVEYMKYRAPLGVGLELLDVVKSLKTVEKQTKVVEAKTDYYKAQSELEKLLREAWGHIESYNKTYVRNGGPLDAAKLESISAKFDTNSRSVGKLQTYYAQIQQAVINDLQYGMLLAEPTVDYKGGRNWAIEDWKCSYIRQFPFYLDKFAGEDGKYLVFYIKNKNEYVQEDGFITLELNTPRITDTEGITKEIENELQEIEKLYTKYWNRLIGYPYKEVYISNQVQTSEGWEKALERLLDLDNQERLCFLAILFRTLDESGSNWPDELTQLFRMISRNEQYIDTNKMADYKNFVRFFLAISQFSYETVGKPLTYGNSSLPLVDDTPYINGAIKEIVDLYDNLSNACQCLKDAKTSLEAAKKKLKDSVEKKRNEWESAATNSEIAGSEFSEKNIQEIESVEEKFSVSDIESLESIVNKRIQNLQELIDMLGKITFCGKPVYQIKSLYEYYKIARDDLGGSSLSGISEVHYKKSNSIEGDNWYNLESRFQNYDGGIFSFNDAGDKTLEFKSTTALYNYMSKAYAGASDEVHLTDAQKKEKEKTDNASQDSAKGKAKNTVNQLKKAEVSQPEDTGEAPYEHPEIKKDGPFPSTISDLSKVSETNGNNNTTSAALNDFGDVGKCGDDDFEKSTDAVSGSGDKTKAFFGSLFSVMENAVETLRNDLYVEEYIMGMFSYRTMEKEAFTNLYDSKIGESLADKLKYANFHLYNKDGALISEYKVNEETVEFFNREDVLEKLETLSNVAMSPANNEQYLNEVEYIIFGDNSSASTENTIFAIRFILNTISAFMNSELNSVARSIALLCFGYPPLTFLVPIAQIAIVIACAIGESVIDKTVILAGYSVPVFKTKDNWIVSPTGIATEGKKIVTDAAKATISKGIQKVTSAIDNCINEIGDGLGKGIDDLSADAKQGLNDALSGAYDETVGKYVDSVTETLIDMVNTYLDIEYKKDTALDINGIAKNVTAQIRSQLRIDSLDKNSLEYKIKNAAVTFIEKKGSEYIKPMVEALNTVGGSTNSGLTSVSTGSGNSTNPLIRIPEEIKKTVTDAVNGTTGTIIDSVAGDLKRMKDDAMDTVRNSIKGGADKFKAAADKYIDGLADKIPDADENISSDSAKLFSMGYSGYLRLFLLIALISNEETVLKRTGDVIQFNLRKRNAGFAMHKSYCFLEIDSEAHIKPLFFSTDGLNRVIQSLSGDENATLTVDKMYQFKFRERSGY